MTPIGSSWLTPERASVNTLAHPHKRTDGGEPRSSRGVTPDGRVILNVASAEELTRLPGVGRKRARAILALRERLKRFRRISDLLRVRGIGVRSLRRMKPHLVLDPPKKEVRCKDGG